MRINGPNHTNFNPYKQVTQNQKDPKKVVATEDNLQISSEAKKLLESQQPDVERNQRIEKLKLDIEHGEYKVNPSKTAKKLMEFYK